MIDCRVTLLCAVLGILGTGAGGCVAQHDTGARKFSLLVNSEPSHATVYLIPEIDWNNDRLGTLAPATPEFQKAIGKYKVTDGKTPVTINADGVALKVVVSLNGQYVVGSQSVTPGEQSSINVDLDKP